VFKLDDSIPEIFARMRIVSEKVLSVLRPHPYYLTKRYRRIENLSFLADNLQSENSTLHHAVMVMDMYSATLPQNSEYDTLLVALGCLMISTKYL
jgi:hypothetical protein